MFCNKCGNKLEDNQKFCQKCGNSLASLFNESNNSQNIQSVNNVNTVENNSEQVSNSINSVENKNVNLVNNQNVQQMNNVNIVENKPEHVSNSINSFENKNFESVNNVNSVNNQNVQQMNNVNIVENKPEHVLNSINSVENKNVQPVNNQNVQQMNNVNSSNNSNDGIKNVFKGIGIGFAVILILSFVMNALGISSDKYFFDFNGNDEGIGGTSNRKGKYSTVILADNFYEGMSIKTRDDAINLIVQDSVSQKDKCPGEIKQIEENIIANYGLTAVNLCEMDLDFAREVENVFKKIDGDYPVAKEYLTNLTLINAPIKENYIAAFFPMFPFASSNTSSTYPWVFKTRIVLNSSYFLNNSKIKSSVDESSRAGHFPKNATRSSTVAHEMGHYLSFIAMMKKHNVDSVMMIDNKNVSKYYELANDFTECTNTLSILNEAYENYKRDKNSKIGFDEWRATISKYAVTKDNSGKYLYDETIAESFHDVYVNGDNAVDASKYIVAVLKSRLGS